VPIAEEQRLLSTGTDAPAPIPTRGEKQAPTKASLKDPSSAKKQVPSKAGPVASPGREPKGATRKTTRQQVQPKGPEAPEPKAAVKPRTAADEWADFEKMLAEEFGATGPITSEKLLQLYRHGSRATVVKYLKRYLKKQAVAEGLMTVGDMSVKVKPGVALDKQIDAFVESLEGAHSTPQTFGKKLPKDVKKALPGGEYNPDDALVIFTGKSTHTLMDQPWKDAFNGLRKTGANKATGQWVFDAVADGIRKTPGMSDGEKASRIARLHDEMFTELGLVPSNDYPIPQIYKWWEILAFRAKKK
jgi:hypothetical protein